MGQQKAVTSQLQKHVQQSQEVTRALDTRLQDLSSVVLDGALAEMIHTDKGIDDGSSKQASQQDVPGLAEIVRHLENRLALMRQEATSLDQLLRSELEVQRRQQNIMTTTLQSIQERLQEVETRCDPIHV